MATQPKRDDDQAKKANGETPSDAAKKAGRAPQTPTHPVPNMSIDEPEEVLEAEAVLEADEVPVVEAEAVLEADEVPVVEAEPVEDAEPFADEDVIAGEVIEGEPAADVPM